MARIVGFAGGAAINVPQGGGPAGPSNDRYYGIGKAETNIRNAVTESSSSGGADAVIELRINEAAYGNKFYCICAVEALLRYLKSNRETSPIS